MAGPQDELIRAFVALSVTEEVRRALEEVQKDLKRAGADVAWVRPENIHLTLVFLGHLPAELLDRVATELDSAAAETPMFSFEVRQVGTFGPPKAPRVIWAGVCDPSGTLGRLQEEILRRIRGLGIGVDDRPFHPHLTLGRVRRRAGVAGLTSRLNSYTNVSCGRVEAREVLLMESLLGSSGAQYRARHASALKGA